MVETRADIEDAAVGIAAAQPQVFATGAWHLAPLERREFDLRKPTCQRFRRVRGERRCHGAEQQEPPVAFAVGVDGAAHTRKDLWPRLRLIEDDALRVSDTHCPFEVESQPLWLLLKIEIRAAKCACKRRLARFLICKLDLPTVATRCQLLTALVR